MMNAAISLLDQWDNPVSTGGLIRVAARIRAPPPTRARARRGPPPRRRATRTIKQPSDPFSAVPVQPQVHRRTRHPSQRRDLLLLHGSPPATTRSAPESPPSPAHPRCSPAPATRHDPPPSTPSADYTARTINTT